MMQLDEQVKALRGALGTIDEWLWSTTMEIDAGTYNELAEDREILVECLRGAGESA